MNVKPSLMHRGTGHSRSRSLATKEVRFSSDMARPAFAEDEDNWPMPETFLLPATPSGSSYAGSRSGSRSRSRSRSITRDRTASPGPIKSALRPSYSEFGDGEVFNPGNKAFVATVNLAARSRSKAPVQALWNLILYSWFPPSDYIVCFPETGLDNDPCVSELRWVTPPSFLMGGGHQHSASMITTKPSPPDNNGGGYFGHRRNPSLDAAAAAANAAGNNASAEPRIFMVQYWSSAADTPVGWRAAREAFARYLYARVAPGRRMVFAIAIGARCEVYGWDGAAGEQAQMVRRHVGAIDLRDADGRILLEKQLTFVGRHGLVYAKASRPWMER